MNSISSGPSEVLKEVFGFDDFRDHQQTLVEGLLAGKDVFGVMPTGGGKSLCYQLPAVMAEGCAVVVSPLIALMKDQVDAARANGIRACCVNSSISSEERREAARAYRAGELDLLYVAPERLSGGGFLDRLRDCPGGAPAFFAIDEAHCLSEWGHDFRPDYLFLTELRTHFPDTPIAAFTATATEKVAADIEKSLNLEQAVKVRASFDRHNLYYEVRAKRDWERQLLEFVQARKDECGIIYRTSRKSVESTADFLRRNGVDAKAYHAGMEADDRKQTQEDFIRDNCRVIVATIAFGMGIDKADVRYVVHGDVPKNIESYYQETGRAGRDGEPSHCLLLYSPGDGMKIRGFFDDVADENERNRLLGLLQAMENFAANPSCRRKALLGYFAEDYPKESCGSCDFCDGNFKQSDVTREARIVMSAMARSGERFGAVHVCDIVTGANTARIREAGHESLKTYGVGADRPKSYWRGVLDALVGAGAVKFSEGSFPVPKLTGKGWAILKGEQSFAMHEDQRVEPEKSSRSRPAEESFPFHSGLFDHLRRLRKEVADEVDVPPYVVFADRTLRQMAALMPADKGTLARVHGMGEHKMFTYGQAFLDAITEYLSDHPEAVSERLDKLPKAPVFDPRGIKNGLAATYLETDALLAAGLTLEQIAAKRDLSLSTIETHVGKLIEDGRELDVRKYLSEEKEELIRKLFAENGTEPLKPIIEAAGGEVSYGQARIVLALVNL
ncbi:DNA helicase RecQ [Haloferula sp.]|uniref:DNA helicase RecQ n=1 Tax=Haloferula sp. TaxID=2497595 RepID=UPI003C78DA7B